MHCGSPGKSVVPLSSPVKSPFYSSPPRNLERRHKLGVVIVSHSEETDGLAHRRLQVERLDVLPVFLEQRDEEVNAQHDVTEDLVVAHLDVPDSDTQAQDFLQLEFDGRADFNKFVAHVLGVSDGGWELAGLGQTGTEETRDLLDQSLGSQEGIILLGELLDELLVLVQLLQIIDRHILEVDLLSTIDISSISKDADGHARTGNVRELDCSRETFVPLWVVVLETDLQFDGLYEIAFFLAVCIGKEFLDGAPHA